MHVEGIILMTGFGEFLFLFFRALHHGQDRQGVHWSVTVRDSFWDSFCDTFELLCIANDIWIRWYI